MQVVIQPTKVPKLVEPFEEEDSADKDPTVLCTTFCHERMIVDKQEVIGNRTTHVSSEPLYLRKSSSKRLAVSTRQLKLTLLPVILLAVASLIILHAFASRYDAPFGSLFASPSRAGIGGMMKEFLSSLEFFRVFL